MTKIVTYQEVIDTAKEVVRGKENYIYTNPYGMVANNPPIRCYNWDHNKNEPSCIVGWILWKVGVPADILIGCPTEGVFDLLHFIIDHLNFQFEAQAVNFLANIQIYQDRGKPWGEALEIAIAEDF